MRKAACGPRTLQLSASSARLCAESITSMTAMRPQGKASLVLEVSGERSFVLARSRSSARCPDRLVVPPAAVPACRVRRGRSAGLPAPLEWSDQPARPGMAYAALEWRGEAGAAGRLASRLRGARLARLRGGRRTGSRLRRPSATPTRPSWGSSMPAWRRTATSSSARGPLRALLEEAAEPCRVGQRAAPADRHGLGRALDPLRQGGDGAPVTWLRQTG